MLERLAPVFPQLCPAANVLETSLNNSNPISHGPLALFNITRMENGQVNLRIQPELIQDIFDDVLAHLDHDAARHTIVTNVADDLLMADMDAQLIEQVLVNLINNAIKYTPEHSRIELFAAPEVNLSASA